MTIEGKDSVPAPRVGIYNRCSTEEEAQKNALAVQAEESREIAVVKKGWVITAQYIESESGTSVKRRTEYQRLLEDMEKDIFDIIMIKSIDRLMRSAKDWYLFLNKLTEHHKRLYIYIDDKFYTPDDSLISGIKAILAEEFSRELSKKIKNSHGRRQERLKQEKPAGLNITRPMFGWDKAEKDVYRLNEAEAQAYREAFDRAEAGQGFYRIAREMYEQGVRGKNGGRISGAQWRKMLYSPRAHGAMVIHTREYDFDAKRFRALPPEEWITVENALPAIVSEAYQTQVLEMIAGRRKLGERDAIQPGICARGRYDLSGRIYCAECGAVYYRTSFQSGGKRYAQWKCSTVLQQGRKTANRRITEKKIDKPGCDNINLLEEELLELIEEACRKKYESLFGTGQDMVGEMMAIVRKAVSDEPSKQELDRLRKESVKLEKKKRVLFEKLMSETISDREFQDCKEELDVQLGIMRSRIELLEEQDTATDREARLAAIRKELERGELINRAKVRELITKIDRMLVYPDGKIEIIFNRTGMRALLRLYGGVEETSEDTIVMRYIHTGRAARKRNEINRRILDILQENPHSRAKDLPGLTGVGYSYINTSIRMLKEEGKLEYERNGNAHGGTWHVRMPE